MSLPRFHFREGLFGGRGSLEGGAHWWEGTLEGGLKRSVGYFRNLAQDGFYKLPILALVVIICSVMSTSLEEEINSTDRSLSTSLCMVLRTACYDPKDLSPVKHSRPAFISDRKQLEKFRGGLSSVRRERKCV